MKNGRGYYYPGTPEYKLMATGKNMDDVKVQEPVAPFNDGLTYTNSISSNCLAFTTKYADVTDPHDWPYGCLLGHSCVMLILY